MIRIRLPFHIERCLNGNQDVGLQPHCELEAAAQVSGLVLSPTVLLARRRVVTCGIERMLGVAWFA